MVPESGLPRFSEVDTQNSKRKNHWNQFLQVFSKKRLSVYVFNWIFEKLDTIGVFNVARSPNKGQEFTISQLFNLWD